MLQREAGNLITAALQLAGQEHLLGSDSRKLTAQVIGRLLKVSQLQIKFSQYCM